ncbi:TPA: glutamine--fructose-6-phosphate transaminase (isomerizing) [Candidatus Delongbacteria bacterium]|nr:MAG: glutamine--fructose-6-phosphate aminotransferase [Candidatus Delongbacteria bacterium GWF2_40_14]HAQ62075.1 glutamine--fructose-6-phosphate transaminase (isomerizing) [Candidatus Delongbacteria bacterium]
MCGIVGYIGNKDCVRFLVDGLKRVEYRGYDSAGILIYRKNTAEHFLVKNVGKIIELEKSISSNLSGNIGIAHTRWATHGEPNHKNSHPHVSNDGNIFLVHNGIIENYTSLKKKLEKTGFTFYSETDTEILVNLIQHYYKGDIEKAVKEALLDVKGTYGIGVFCLNEPDKLIAARLGSPLLIGIGKNENYFASDPSSVLKKTSEVVYMQDREIAVITKDSVVHKTLDDELLEKSIEKISFELTDIEKSGYDHFMLKEIFEQPKTITDSMRGRLLLEEGTTKLGGLNEHPEIYNSLINADKIYIVACGTSWHSALIGEYMLEEYAKIPVEVEYASEFRYRDPIITPKTVVIAISQSGETADTLAAIKEAKRKGAVVLGICNVVGSSISKETDAGVYLHAGPEIGVASTKAFTSQVIVLALITIDIARRKHLSFRQGYKIVKELKILPALVESILENSAVIKEIAKKFSSAKNFLYLGRGYNFPVALEGALKLKEISYIHAEGYPAAEMKHGPIALIDENMPVIFIAIKDTIYDKVITNIKEVKARNGVVISIASYGDEEIDLISDYVIKIPDTTNLLSPILTVIPLQLLAYYIAVEKGYNVDMPRNLAKSVTVE